MTFWIDRGFAEVQILQTSETYLLNRLEYFDKILQTIWCWRDLAKGFAKWHLSSVEALPGANFWKKWKWPYLLNWVEYFDKLLCKHWYWKDLAQEIANWHFFIGRGFAELQILKKWKWPYLLNC